MNEEKVKKDYKKLELKTKAIFEKEGEFIFEGEVFRIKTLGKPTVAKTVGGEPKTDLYILASSPTREKEFKISIKKRDYEFAENKIRINRAKQIWGKDYAHIITNAAISILDRFKKEYLCVLSKNTYVLGWKVEITNKKRNLSVPLNVSEQHIRECIYMGKNLSPEIRNAKIDKVIIPDSGVAEYILKTTLEELDNMNASKIIERCLPINSMEITPHYIVFTGNGFRTDIEVDPTRKESDSTDGKRTLGVIVEWSQVNGKLKADINCNEPFLFTGYEKKKELKNVLNLIGKFHPSSLLKDDFENPSIFNDRPGKGNGNYNKNYTYNGDEEVKSQLTKKRKQEKHIFFESKNNITIDELQFNNDKFNVTSLFCGVGGMDLGVELAGLEATLGTKQALEAFQDHDYFNTIRHESVFNIVYSNDISKEALNTYRMNFPKQIYLHHKDIREVCAFPVTDLLLGAFPCQGFSKTVPRLIDDERNSLYFHFVRCLVQTQPKFFITESVRGALTLQKGEVFQQIIQDFVAAGYRVYYKLVNARDYGVPQDRERVYLVGVRNDLDFKYEFPKPTHGEGLQPYVTLRDAIWDLEHEPGDYFTGSYSALYMSRNRKKCWEDQSFSIPASGQQAPLHPGGQPMEYVKKDKWIFPDGEKNHRRLSIKEISRIQTFPDWFKFSDGGNAKVSSNGRLNKIYKQIGSAVPVMLARALAKPIAEYAVENIQKN